MKYKFGIMSQLWELESNDEILAEVAMCLFYKKDIPIAIYFPTKKAIQPKEILEQNFLHCQNNNEALIQVMDSIIEVKNE
jgi:hypothetical protein